MRWKVPVLVLSVLGLLGLAGWGVSLRLDSLLDEHRRECDAIEQTFPLDVSPRPAILGPEEQGNIWELLLPAFAALEELDEYKNLSNFDAHGTTGDTPRLIDAAHRSLELCRRAAGRRDRAWSGPRNSGGNRAARAVRALSSKGLLLWRDGRDAEAAEWMIAALTVGYDWASLAGDWDVLTMSEAWVSADLKDLLSEQSLSPAQLDDLARRLALLRTLRPGFARLLRMSSCSSREKIMGSDVWISEEDSKSDGARLSERVGWRDCFSLRVAKLRILNSLRSCERELEGVAWEDPAGAWKAAQLIIDRYDGRFVHSQIPYLGDFVGEEQALLATDIVAVAVDCARFQAVHGRLPKTWEEYGIPRAVLPRLALEEDRITLMGPVRGEWPLARRQ